MKTFGVANLVIFIWLSGLTLLLLFILNTLNTLIELQQQAPASTVRLWQKHQAAKRPEAAPPAAAPACVCRPEPCPVLASPLAPTVPECPPCRACPAGRPEGPAVAPPAGPSSPCVAGDRPRRVKPLLRWLNMDGGRDFFKVLTEGNKAAQRDHALIVEVGVGDGRQAVEVATLGYNVISIDGSRKALGQGKNFLRAATKNHTAPLAGNITWVYSAVGDQTGNVTFFDYGKGIGRMLDDNDNSSVTHRDNPKWKAGLRTVPLNRLDDLIRDAPRAPYILKIDVEGHELPVLQGAARTLAQRPPIVILEFNPPMMNWSAHADAHDVLSLLHGYGYDLYDASISEPAKKGFTQRYGAYHRPTEYRQLVDWLHLSSRWDWWGSWTDIVALRPDQDEYVKPWP